MSSAAAVDAATRQAQRWQTGSHAFAWGPGLLPHLMAIVNLTPDSFSDGGRLADAGAAVEFARAAFADGASIVDIGGESTRPGAMRIDAAEQIRRTHQCIVQLAARGRESRDGAAHGGCPDDACAADAERRADSVPPLAISIDTTLAAVAEAALDAGACIVNDVSAGTEDPRLLEVVAARGAGLVLMHRRAAPPDDRYSDRYETPPAYDDVAREVHGWLAERVDAAVRAGVARACIAVDPGLGFGKSVAQNFELVARLQELAALGLPIMVGASRKSFVGAAAQRASPADRLAGSLGVALAAAANGAAVLRVHDVRAHADALAAWSRARAR